MKTNTQRYLSAINAIKKVRALDKKARDVSWDDIEEAMYSSKYKGPMHTEIGYDDCLRGFESYIDAATCADFIRKTFHLTADVVQAAGSYKVKVYGVKDSVKDELKTSIKLEKMRPSDTNGSKEELEDIKIMPYGNVTRAQWESFLRKAKWPYWLDWESLVNETVRDSIKDSPASEVVSAIRRQYPQVKIEQYFVKKGDHDVFKLRIDNAPGVDRFDHTKSVSFERFVEHLLKQHGFDYISVGTHDKTVYADAYFDRRTGDSCDDVDTSKLSLKEAKKLYEEGKISQGQLDDVAIRLFEESKKTHDDLDDADINDLIASEYEAISDYQEALSHCKEGPAKDKLQHILDEEKEHVVELEELKEYLDSQTTKDGVSPMTYKKLKELGYGPDDWAKWDDKTKVEKSQGQKSGGKEEPKKAEVSKQEAPKKNTAELLKNAKHTHTQSNWDMMKSAGYIDKDGNLIVGKEGASHDDINKDVGSDLFNEQDMIALNPGVHGSRTARIDVPHNRELTRSEEQAIERFVNNLGRKTVDFGNGPLDTTEHDGADIVRRLRRYLKSQQSK